MDFVVPFSMKWISVNMELGDFFVGDFDAFGVDTGVEFRMDLEPGGSAGGRNQAHNDLKTGQRLAAPVLGDAREEAVFDLVPFAGARRKMTHGYAQRGFIG